MNRKIPCVCGVWGLGFGCVWVCDSVAFDGFGDGFRGTALVLGKHRPPYGFDIHQLVQELKPLVVRLVGTQEPVCDALLTGFAPFRHAVEGSVVEGGHGGDCTLCVGGKGVGHVCVGLGTQTPHGVSAHQASSVCLARGQARSPPLR